MFAGHVGAAMVIGRVERRVNLGLLVAAALLLDIVLWLLVLLGWESVTITADFARTHQPEFVFPYSHSLVAAVVWSMLAAALTWLLTARLATHRLRAAGWVAAAVFSHWLLDALVHLPELPLAGVNSLKVGFGLWNTMPLALTVEGAIAVLGLGLFLHAASLTRAKKVGLTLMALFILASTIAGMTLAPAPPSALAMAASSLLTIVAVCALSAWLAKRQGH